MAFSTFMGSMAATNGPITPSIYTFRTESPCSLVESSNVLTNAVSWIAPNPNNINSYYAVGYLGQVAYAWVVNRNATASSVSVGTALNLGAYTNSGSSVCADVINSNSFFMVRDTGNNNVYGNYITNNNGNLTVTSSGIATTNNGGNTTLNIALCVALTSTNVLVFGGSSVTSVDNTLSLLNPGANPPSLIKYQQINASSITPSNGQMGLFRIDDNRAMLSYNNGGTAYLNTIDVASNTMTLQPAFNTGVVLTNTFAQIYGINHTTALMVYNKSPNLLAVRVITLGDNGAITMGFEHTISAPGILSTYAPFRIANFGDNYVIGYAQIGPSTNYYGGQILVTSCKISETQVIFDSSGFSVINSAGNYNASNVLPSVPWNVGMFIPIDDTHFAYSSPNKSVGGTTETMTGIVDVNPTTQTWGVFTPLGNTGFTSANIDVIGSSTCWIGTNRFVSCGNSGSGTPLAVYTSDSYGGNSTGVTNAGVSTGVLNATGVMCPLGYSTTLGVSRVLLAYASASNTITVQVVSIAPGGVPTLNTPATFAVSGINVGNIGYYNLIPLSSDKAMFIGYNGTGYSAAIINVNAGALGIGSIGTYQNIYSPAGYNFGTGNSFVQWNVINSNYVAVLFITQNTGSALWAGNLAMLNISGNTVTTGTPVTLFSTNAFSPGTYGVTTLNNGTGIAVYSGGGYPNPTIFGYPFTYSGTTITLGTVNTLIPSSIALYNTGMIGQGNPNLTAISNTEAILMYSNSISNQIFTAVRLQYNSINSLTAGVPRAVGTNTGGTSTVGFGLIPTDNSNNTFMTYYSTYNAIPASSNLVFNQYYRG